MFALKSTYYLTDLMCAAGNEEFPHQDGNGNEKWHIGNGYGKITLLWTLLKLYVFFICFDELLFIYAFIQRN